MSGKIFVRVNACFDTEGRMIPTELIWDDGRRFEITRVINSCRAASLRAGGQGTRYTCVINGAVRYIFFDGLRWFVEPRIQ